MPIFDTSCAQVLLKRQIFYYYFFKISVTILLESDFYEFKFQILYLKLYNVYNF